MAVLKNSVKPIIDLLLVAAAGVSSGTGRRCGPAKISEYELTKT